MKKIYIIGAGGVGSWLTPSICLLKKAKDVCVIDADILEEKNLNRQLFTTDDIGKSKAEALGQKYGCEFKSKWFNIGLIDDLHKTDWLLVAVDNHTARRAALDACDTFGCRCITGANEVTSAEAFYYQRDWKGSPHDPRTYYTEINTDKSGDPQAAAIGCTGEAQVENRQLVSANFMAAALMQHLFVIWDMELPKVGVEMIPHLPLKIVQNLTSYNVVKIKG
jgi:hypothetical protein